MSNNPDSTYVKITLEDIEHKVKIDRIGLQIRKDSASFSDNATGSIPQIDAIIKTIDGKIYKATQNLNSTYTDYDGNKTTTTNAAEPVGASMCEKFVKEYEWKNQENTNNAQAKVVYGNGIYLSSTVGNIWDIEESSSKTPWPDYRNIYYSKNGKKWNQILLDNAIKTETPNINEYMISDICYGNGKFVVAIITDEYHLLFGYSTNAIDWTITQSNGLPNNYLIVAIKVCYGNNKYSGLALIGIRGSDSSSLDCYSIYSTDGINWNSNIVKTNINANRFPYYLVRDICYGNNKFISVVSMFEFGREEYLYDLNDNLYYSTDGINWTSTVALSTFEHLQRIFYINNKFYLCSNMNYAYSTDGINWTKYTPKWSDGTVMDDNSFLSTQIMCKYDNNSLLGLFIDNSKNAIALERNNSYNVLTGYTVCKSSDGITWDKLYNIDIVATNEYYPDGCSIITKQSEESIKGLHPSNMIYVNDSICIVSNSAFMPYTYTRWIHYYWTVNKKDNIELSHSITDQPSVIVSKPFQQSKIDALSKTVDITKLESFTEGDLDEHPTGAYRFSGWSQSNITFTKDTPRVTEITGTWNWVDMVKYSYSWNAPSYSDLTGLVTLPTGGSAYAGETVTVDTKYNSDSKVEVLNWTQFTGLDDYCLAVCYGNGRFIITGNNSNKYLYSSDGINWTESILPNTASINNEIAYRCIYAGDRFFAVNRYQDAVSKIFLYSSDGINWTEGKFPIVVRFTNMLYGNGRFICSCNYYETTTNKKYLYSSDGINWTEGTLPIRPSHIYYGAGKFVVTTYDSSEYAYSTDGINWTEGTLPIRPSHICYGAGKFVAVARSSSNKFAYSTDGITWTEGTLPITDKWGPICYGSGIFILMGGDIFLYSSDGINWTTGKHDSMSYDSITLCYGQGKFICGVYKKYYYLTIPTSYYQFSGWNPSTDFIINENKTISGTWSKKNKLRVSYSWSNQPSGMKSKVPSDEYYHYGDNVMIDTTYNNKSGYKSESWSVSEATVPSNQYWRSVCYGNGKFVAVGSNPNMSAYSSDGINWTQGNIPSSQHWCSVCYGNDKFVAVADSQTNIAAYSSDGINWTTTSLPSSQYWSSVCYGNGKFVAVAEVKMISDDNRIAYSTNGINWRNSNVSKTHTWGPVCYGNGKFITISSTSDETGSSAVAYSSDGINWTEGTMPNYRRWESVCYGNDKFVSVVFENTSAFAYSTDGINWTEGTMPSSQKWNSVCYGDGKFVAVGYNSNIFAYSIDGITWTQGTMPAEDYWGPVCYGNGKFVAFGHDTVICLITPSTTYYQFSGWNKSDFNITADTAVNGSWSQVSAGGGTNLSELSVGDTFFLGKYQVESETPWPIEWEIVHQTSDYQIAMTKQIIDLRAFDGKEPTNTNNNRKNNGNNNWQYSNIEQWMNSDQASWYSAQHQYDAPPTSANCWQYSNGTTYNAYDSHKGFLYYWTADEKALLKDMTLTLANNTKTDGGGSYTWTGKVWLPTYTQMGGGQNNGISEGEAFSKFTDNTSRIKSLHPNCIANNEYAKVNNSSGNWYYWMSSADPSFSHTVRRVNSAGSIGNHAAYFGQDGFAPCICLPRTGWSDPNKAPDLNYIT